jgi:hypothetical protein
MSDVINAIMKTKQVQGPVKTVVLH